MKFPWKTYAFFILLSEGVGALSGWLSRAGMEQYNDTILQPPLSPPGFLFPIVWGVLYALMGIGAARVWLNASGSLRRRAMVLFGAQLAVNFFWSLIFFNLQAFGLAFLWLLLLWGLIFAMYRAFQKVDPLAARLQIPYLLWVAFAGYLTAGVWVLNR